MTTTPEQIEAVARMRLMIQSAVEDDARAWELTDTELSVIAEAAINTMRPFIRAEALEEAAKVVEEDMKSGCQCHECMRRYTDAKAIRSLKETP
jgi:hypothetical protein